MTDTTTEPNTHPAIEAFLGHTETDTFSKPNAETTEPTAPAQADEPETDAPPKKSYRDRLEELNISEDMAYAVIDDMCERGSFLKKIVLRPARGEKKALLGVLTTRSAAAQGYIIEQLGKNQDNMLVAEMMMSRMQLAASLLRHVSHDLEPINEQDDKEKLAEAMIKNLKFVEKLPAPVIVSLLNKLAVFDLEVATIMSEGYEDFF